MEVLLKLYSTIEKAVDGSSISRQVTEEYLKSEDYKTLIKDKLGLGGVTHKDRTLSSDYKGLIGQDDQVIINNNATHYFKKIFFKDETDPFVYGIVEIFDPDKFAGKQRDNILNLLGLLQSGVKLPASIVIHAIWDERTDEAKKIIRIKGVDFTQNNAFRGAGTIEVKESIKVETKEYSMPTEIVTEFPGCVYKSKAFSDVDISEVTESKEEVEEPEVKETKESIEEVTETKEPESKNGIESLVESIETKILEKVEDSLEAKLEGKSNEKSEEVPPESMEPNEDQKSKLSIPNESDKTYTRRQIIEKYGLNSIEAQVTKGFSELTESQLTTLAGNKVSSNEIKLDINKLLGHLDESGEIEAFLKEYLTERGFDLEGLGSLINIPLDRSGIGTILSSVPTSDPSWKILLGNALDKYFRNVPKLAKFSSINSVRDRLISFRYPRLTVINRLLRSYKSYWSTYGKSMPVNDRKYFTELIIEDLRVLLNKVIPEIRSGQSLNALYGLSQFSDLQIMQSATKLSQIYRKVIISQEILKFIPANQYIEFNKALKEFYQSCLDYITGDDSLKVTNIGLIN